MKETISSLIEEGDMQRNSTDTADYVIYGHMIVHAIFSTGFPITLSINKNLLQFLLIFKY